MRKAIYLFGFGLVATSVLARLVLTLLALFKVQPHLGSWFIIPEMFGHPAPAMLQILLPSFLRIALFFILAFLILRRLWLLFGQGSLIPPQSFGKTSFVFFSIALASLVLSAITLLLSILLSAGSGVPAAMLLLPAAFLLPIAVSWVEVASFTSSLRANVITNTTEKPV